MPREKKPKNKLEEKIEDLEDEIEGMKPEQMSADNDRLEDRIDDLESEVDNLSDRKELGPEKIREFDDRLDKLSGIIDVDIN